MQRRSNPPQQHATRDPPNHAISPPERGARGLQRDEEGKEEHNRCIQIAFVETYVGREMRRLCVANLGFRLAIQSSLRGPLPLPRQMDSLRQTHIRLIQRIKQKQRRQKRQKQTIQLQHRPPMHPRLRIDHCALSSSSYLCAAVCVGIRTAFSVRQERGCRGRRGRCRCRCRRPRQLVPRAGHIAARGGEWGRRRRRDSRLHYTRAGPGRITCRVRVGMYVWVGGCEGAAAGAVRVEWSAEVMGFVGAGVPLRGLDPAFVMLVEALTGPDVCFFSSAIQVLYHTLSIDRYSTQTSRHLVMTITSLTYNLGRCQPYINDPSTHSWTRKNTYDPQFPRYSQRMPTDATYLRNHQSRRQKSK
jgi:hypothetical protein